MMVTDHKILSCDTSF